MSVPAPLHEKKSDNSELVMNEPAVPTACPITLVTILIPQSRGRNGSIERPYIENLFPRVEGQRVLQVQVSLAVRALAGDLNTLTFWGTGLKQLGEGGGVGVRMPK